MSDTFLSALVAAGGNSRAARSARARLQFRDRYGRWVDMGRGLKFKFRDGNGVTRSVVGTFVGAKTSDTAQVYVSKDPSGLPDGFYDVSSSNAQEFVAHLNPEQLKERGIKMGVDVNGNAVGERAKEDVPNINELVRSSAPEGWEAIEGTYAGKKVIQTDDKDFRIHYGGKDDSVLLEDRRANPGQADEQRSIAEAFKRVNDVDIQREESGDAGYSDLEADNEAKLSQQTRNDKIDQIKLFEAQTGNDRVGVDQKQRAREHANKLIAELDASGEPYEPEGKDSDEAHAARKAEAATPPEDTALASTQDVDTTTFDVSPEGYLVPTGKKTNDISTEGMAAMITNEKETLSKGGARLVVDTDAGTAEIYNSADTLENAKAQAGGLGQTEVIDLAAGKPVKVSDNAVDPNSPDVNPNLNGETNGKDSNPDAVEPERTDAGTDSTTGGEPDGEAEQPVTGPDADNGGDGPGEPADRGVTTPEEGDEPETPSSVTPGSKEDLEARRAQVQTALENSGDPKDIIALNEQADALDNRIKASEPVRRTAGDVSRDMEANEAERQEILRLSNESGGDADTLRGGDLESLESRANKAEAKADDLNRTLNRLETRVIPKLEKDYAALRRELDEVNGVQTLDFDADRTTPKADKTPVAEEPDAPEDNLQPSEANTPDVEPESSTEGWAANPLRPTKAEVKGAPAGSFLTEEHVESGDKRLFRKREDGKWEQVKTDGSGETTGYVTRGDTFDHQGSAVHYASDGEGMPPAAAPATPARTKADIDSLPVEDFSAEFEELGSWRARAKADGSLELYKPGSILDNTPEETRPLENIFRVISEDDYNGIRERGSMKSDGRMNVASNEGTVATHRDPTFYAPGGIGVRGRVVRMDYNPADGWWVDSDGYVKTPKEIPAERFNAQSDWTVGVGRMAVDPNDPSLPKHLARGLNGDVEYALSEASWSSEDRDKITAVNDVVRQAYRKATHGGDGTQPNFDYETTGDDAREYVSTVREQLDTVEFNGKEELLRNLDAANGVLDSYSGTPKDRDAAVQTAFPGDRDPINPAVWGMGEATNQNRHSVRDDLAEGLRNKEWFDGSVGRALDDDEDVDAHEFAVARDENGEVVGFISWLEVRYDDEEHRAELEEGDDPFPPEFIIDGLYGSTDHKGAGTALMEHVARKARDGGGELHVSGAVQRAKGFYAARGGDTDDRSSIVSWSDENRDALASGSTPVVSKRPDEPSEVSADGTPINNYQEPGNADEVATARDNITQIDNMVDSLLDEVEKESDPQRQAEYLSRIRTLNRDRRTQENALNRALGNTPMDFNKDLGWNSRTPENRGSLPEPPEGFDAPTTPATLPDEPTDLPEARDMGSPAVLDTGLDAPTEDELDSEALRRTISGEGLTPEDQARLRAISERENSRDPQERLDSAEAGLERRENEYREVLMREDYTDEEFEIAEGRREWARQDVEHARERLEMSESYRKSEELDAREAEASDQDIQNILEESEAAQSSIDNLDPSEGTGGLLDQADDPNNVSANHENSVEAAKAELQGKEMSDHERELFENALDSGILSDNQLETVRNAIATRPNRANTATTPRPEKDQPDYGSRADADIIRAEREDPDFVFDEDLVWRKIQEEYPDAREMDNGDLVLGETINKGKRYQTVLRRTKQNRYMVYVLETDTASNRRAKRIGNTEWHSYEALEKRIQQADKIINSKSPAGSLARRKDQPTENLGAKPFPADDFLGDFANPDADLPETGDPKFDRLIQTAAEEIRSGNGDLEDIESILEGMDPGSTAVKTIMNTILGRAQAMYRPDTSKPFQLYDGETAEVGMSVDWTNWHQEKDWWITDKFGRRVENPDKTPNPNYGMVSRGEVMGYVKENKDGKGHTYGDHVWVQFYDNEGKPVGNWVKRSAQTLRRADEGSPTGAPFFSKREEWRNNPEELVRRFRVPASDETSTPKTQAKAKSELPQSRTVNFTPRGSLPGYSNIEVPESPAEIAGLITREEITPSVKPVSDLRPGMMIVRMDDEGNQHVDSVIRVENLGDGGYRIHAARPDGTGSATVDSFILPEGMDIPVFSSPAPKPANRTRKGKDMAGKNVEFNRDGVLGNGVVIREEKDGSLLVESPESGLLMLPPDDVTQISRAGAASAIRADLMELLENADVPPALRQSILYKLFSSRTTSAMIGQLTSLIHSFDAKTPKSRALDSIFNILKVSPTVQNRIRAALEDDQ